MIEEPREDSALLDLLIAKHEVVVSVKIARDLIEPLERLGRSWDCRTNSETIERMIDKIENGGPSDQVFLGNEVKRLIRAYLDSGRRLPVICELLNRSGQVAHDGGSWTTQKLSVFCQYHGLDYRRTTR